MGKRMISIAFFAACLSLAFNYAWSQETAEDFNLGQVVVTATKTEHTLGDVPVAVDVVTQEDFRKRNVTTVQEALELLTGVRVVENSSSWGNKGNVEIQGMNANHTLILVDGQKMVGGHNAVDLQQISLDMVERIEIVQGPASALYGSEAVGGVINIITKSAPEKPFVSLENFLGSRGRRKHSVTAGASTEKLGTLVSYGYNESDGVHASTDRFKEHFFDATFDYKFSPQLKWTLKPHYSHNKMNSEERVQERLGLNSLVEWSPDELSKLSLRGSMLNYQHWTKDKSSNWDNDTYEGEINYSRLMFDRHTLMTGIHITEEEIEDLGKAYNADQTLYSYYLQDEIDLDPFVLVLGARIDEHDRWDTQVNPKFSLLYKVNEDLKLRGSVGTAFRAPSLAKLYADGWRMGPYMVYANPDLEPEESLGYQLGGEYRISKKFLTKLSLFRNEVDDLINYTLGSGYPMPMNWVNIDEAVMQGVEWSLDALLTDRLTANIGYTFLDTEDKSTKKELANKPRHKLTLEVGYKIPVIEVLANLEMKYSGRTYSDAANTDRLGGYTTLNLALTKNLGENTQVFARVDNLTGKKNVVTTDYDIDGTEFLAGLRVKF